MPLHIRACARYVPPCIHALHIPLFAWTLVVIALSFLLEWAVGGLLRRAEGPEGGRRP